MDLKVKKKILKDLIVGARVKYVGPSPYYSDVGVKIRDSARGMYIAFGGIEFRAKYHNLTCPEIEKAQEVINALLAETVNPDDLPF